MRKKSFFLLFSLISVTSILAQKSIDLSMIYPPGSGIFRSFSIYEPKGFNPNKTQKLIVGLHPYNTSVWSGKTWRDTLRSFADLVNVLLICPDGGSGGRIDDQADYDFTEALIDTMMNWYNLDKEKIFVLGFSVGGKAAYEFSLSHPKLIKGAIPIGAAIDGVDFSGIIHNAKCHAYFLVHGDKDSPNSRYFPMKSDLEDNLGLVDGIIMANIGNTINFPSRNTILKLAFTFIDTAECDFTAVRPFDRTPKVTLHPNQISPGMEVNISLSNREVSKLQVLHPSGKLIETKLFREDAGHWKFGTEKIPRGINFIVIHSEGEIIVRKLVVY